MKTYFQKLHYSKISGITLLLLVPTFFYWLITSLRAFLYKIGVIKSEKLPAYVISIGNLTTGGTGKTPITCEIANYINQKLNKKTAIISRGYGGQLSNKNTNIISNGEKIFYDSIQAGDEPFWMAANSPSTAVITGKNRVKSGQYAIENFNSQVLLLDDGFQHLKLKRDLDIVLIDCMNVFGNGFLLPAGPLREEEKQLKRADKVLIVNKNPKNKVSEEQCEKLAGLIHEKYSKEAIICQIMPDKIYNLRTNEQVNSLKTLAFAGIGQPESFFNSLKNQNIDRVSQKVYVDHYLYTKLDIENLVKQAQELGADSIITTEKDAVKIQPFLDSIESEIPICALKLRVNLDMRELLKDFNGTQTRGFGGGAPDGSAV